MKRFILPVVCLAMALAVPASAGFRCGSALVDAGDWPVEVRERCGDPDYVATYPTATIPGIGVVQEVEHWYYNRGPRKFMRRLEFRNGRLQRQETLGYGFTGNSPGPCEPSAIDTGTSEFEVVARCGEPLDRRVEWATAVRPGYRNPGTIQGLVPVEEWLYDFGNGRYRRSVILRNGRVDRLEDARKPH